MSLPSEDMLRQRQYVRGGTAAISSSSGTVTLAAGKVYLITSNVTPWYYNQGGPSVAASASVDFPWTAYTALEFYAGESGENMNTVAFVSPSSGIFSYMERKS